MTLGSKRVGEAGMENVEVTKAGQEVSRLLAGSAASAMAVRAPLSF